MAFERIETRTARNRGEWTTAPVLAPVLPEDDAIGDDTYVTHATKYTATLELDPADLASTGLTIDLAIEGQTRDGWRQLAACSGWHGGIIDKNGNPAPPMLSWFSQDNRVLTDVRVRYQLSRRTTVGVLLESKPIDILTTRHHSIGDRSVTGSATTGTSLTYSHTVSGSTNLALWVGVTSYRGAGSSDPTGITYAGAGNPLTELADFLGGASNDNACSLWRRIAPATGANNVVVTHSASHDITAASISYSGVDQTTPNDAIQELDTTDTTPSHDVTSATNDVVVSFAMGWNWDAAAATGGLTERYEDDNAAGVNSIAVGDAPGAASVTCSWTFGASYDDPHGLFSFNINQASGATETVVTIGVLNLTTTKFAPTVSFTDNKTVTIGLLQLLTQTFAPIVSTPVTATIDLLELVTAAFAPTVSFTDNKTVTIGLLELVTAAFAPVVSFTDNKTITIGLLELLTQTFAPVVSFTDNKTVTIGLLELALDAFAPVVSFTDNKTITIGLLELLTQTFAPAVNFTDNKTVTIGLLELLTQTFAPVVGAGGNITVTIDLLELVTQTFAPDVDQPVTVTPGLLELVTATFAPTVGTPTTVTIDLLEVLTQTFAPVVSFTENKLVEIGLLELVTATFAPVVTGSDNVTVTVEPLALTTQTFAPELVMPVEVVVDTLAVLTATFAPLVTATANVTIIVLPLALLLETFAPIVGFDKTIEIGNLELELVGYPPTVRIGVLQFPPYPLVPIYDVNRRNW